MFGLKLLFFKLDSKFEDTFPYIHKRFVESLLIMLLSSFPVYFFILIENIMGNQQIYIILFSIDAIIFYVLNYIFLKKYIIKTDKISDYLKPSLLLFVIQLAISLVCMYTLPNMIYTALFGFTKMPRALGVSDLGSSLMIWAVYLIEIFYFAIDKKIFLKKSQNPKIEDIPKIDPNASISKRSVKRSLFFTIITLGIYGFYWEYQIIKDIKIMKQQSTTGIIKEMLLILLVPPYAIYWCFTRSRFMEMILRRRCLRAYINSWVSSIFQLFFLGIVNLCCFQANINKLYNFENDVVEVGNQSNSYFLRRCFESILIMILASIPALIGVLLKLDNNALYKILCLLSLIIFAIASFVTLKMHISSTKGTKVFILVNLTLLILQILFSILCFNFANKIVNSLFFGYMNFIIAVSKAPILSMVTAWGVYVLEMIYFISDKTLYEKLR